MLAIIVLLIQSRQSLNIRNFMIFIIFSLSSLYLIFILTPHHWFHLSQNVDLITKHHIHLLILSLPLISYFFLSIFIAIVGGKPYDQKFNYNSSLICVEACSSLRKKKTRKQASNEMPAKPIMNIWCLIKLKFEQPVCADNERMSIDRDAEISISTAHGRRICGASLPAFRCGCI